MVPMEEESWLVLAMDFEIATRIPPSRKGPDNATEHMRERAGLMSDASKALLRGLSTPLKHQIAHCSSILAFRSYGRAGLRHRPALLQPEAVGYELGIQVMLHPSLMGENNAMEVETEHEVLTSSALLPHLLRRTNMASPKEATKRQDDAKADPQTVSRR